MNLYTIYRIENTVDDFVYVGKTKGRQGRCPMKTRFGGHKWDTSNKKQINKFQKHMKKIGIENFEIIPVKEIFGTNEMARIQEQIELWNVPKEKRLNTLRAYSHNREKTRDNEKKKKSRMDYYHRKKEDPEWLEKERERNRIRMRERRARARNAVRD